ncbi:glycine-rich RNA-binding protein isoform X1 [Prunus yedoensis var. nudiflora]|uniref:Glycine-rich RNA-binding protein isoform X1 n=1 Tax=Prunus yedoensis var. nudiflora TaxID=2094558 RepID=A0A314ZEZ6_PRUYE|nr:glycine-rich RNA-binding protein isoform X1 [Prunus yedoensis var. nudiflora]
MAKRLSFVALRQQLSSFTNNEQLKRLFSSFGDVTDARMVVDRITQRPRGFGFVTYKSDVEAQKALKAMNGRMVDGRLIFIEVAQTQKQEEDTKSR